MVKRLTQQSIIGLVAMLLANICFAEDVHEIGLGNCGFTGPDYLTNDYFCSESKNHSSSAIKKQAALQLLGMAWDWVTGAEPEDSAKGYVGQPQGNLNEGQVLEPKFRLSARSDEIYLTVAYEF